MTIVTGSASRYAVAQRRIRNQGYISDLLALEQSLTFSQLVSSIYEAYPNMKINSV